jgi:hypothetical protein
MSDEYKTGVQIIDPYNYRDYFHKINKIKAVGDLTGY